MTGELSVLTIPGGTIGAEAFGSQGQRAILTIDASTVDVSTIKVLTVPGGTLATAPSSAGSPVYAVVTMTLTEAAGHEWRVFWIGNIRLTRVQMTDTRFWALLIVDVADATLANYRNYQIDGGVITTVFTGTPGYHALLALSKDSVTAANVRAFQSPAGVISRQEMTTPGFFAFLYSGGVPIPTNTVAPSIAGAVDQPTGAVLTVTPGTWTGTPSLTYQWNRGGVAIGGETGLTHTTVVADLGTAFTCTETDSVSGISVTSNTLNILTYQQRILSVQTANLVQLLPLNDASGTAAVNAAASGASLNGTYTNGVTLGNTVPAFPDGTVSAGFDAVNDLIQFPSAAIDPLWSPTEMTLWGWGYGPASLWTSGAIRRFFGYGVDASNLVVLRHTATNDQLEARYTAGATAKSATFQNTFLRDSWHCFALTVSKSGDALILYVDGVKRGATVTGLGTWAGSLADAQSLAGAGATTTWAAGFMKYLTLWKTPLSAAEIAQLSTV